MSPDRGEVSSLQHTSIDTSATVTEELTGHFQPEEGPNMDVEKAGLEKSEQAVENDQSRHRQREGSIPRNRLSQHEAASITSSVPSSKGSRRDSAISSSSRQRSRRKPSRSTSHPPIATLIDVPNHATPNPTRPYPRRIISSPHIQTKGPNIEEALALHERSCRIFGPSSRPTTSGGPEVPPIPDFERPRHLYRSITTSEMPATRDLAPPRGPIRAHTTIDVLSEKVTEEQPRQYDNFVPATIMHWTSTETRRKEYRSIDKSNKGVRGFFKKLFPKLVAKGSDSRFYDEKEGSDAGSVRRFRLDLPDEEESGSGKKL